MTRAALFSKHQRLADMFAGSFFLPGAELDDVRQEARIALWLATASWDPGTGVPFPSFARVVMRRRMADAVTKATRLKAQVLTNADRTDSRGRALDFVDPGLSPEDRLVVLEELRGVAGALVGLTTAERAAIIRIVREEPLDGKADDNARASARRKLRRAA